jgi:peptidoglycan/xylan/chitin deacetylase (PgdA/CDA1 family)
MKKSLALFMALLMTVGLFSVVGAASDIEAANRGIGWAAFGSASLENPNWDTFANHITGPFVEFDVTVEGLHTITLPAWPRSDDLWITDSVIYFLRPVSPTAPALPVTLDSVSINGEARISNRAFAAGGGFWTEEAGPFFGDITLNAASRVVNIPGYSIYFFAVPDIVNAVELAPWLYGGTSELLGTINEGDIVTVSFLVGEPPETEDDTEPLPRPVRPADPQLSDFPEGTRFIALTFDDGPNTNFTVQILDELARLGATATFYVNPINFNASTLPVVYRMISEGHDVDNHGWNHTSFGADILSSGFTYTTVDQAFDDMTRASRAIFDATGYWPFSFRAPFFEWGGENNILYGLDRQLNMAFVGAGLDTNDWMPERSPQDIADTVLLADDPSGGVVLLHDCGGQRQRTVDSLELFIPEMQARGYEFVSLRQLMILTDTTPQLFTGANMWPNANAWVPPRGGTEPVPLWPDNPEWRNEDWWTGETPPWERNIAPQQRVFTIRMGSLAVTCNEGSVFTMDFLPEIINGRIWLCVRALNYIFDVVVDDNGSGAAPLRSVAEAAGASLSWDGNERSVDVFGLSGAAR